MLTRKDPTLYPYSRNLLTIARPDATEGLMELLDGATRKSPADRVQSMTDFRQQMSGGTARVKTDQDLAFDLDTHAIRIEAVKRGEIVKRRIKLTGRGGREIYGKLRSEQDWIRFKFDVFRGSSVELDFSVSTYELSTGETYCGTIQIDTDAGVDEVEVQIEIEGSLGTRLVRGLRSMFGKQQPVDIDF
jgi:hypothetical protein